MLQEVRAVWNLDLGMDFNLYDSHSNNLSLNNAFENEQ